MITDAFSHDNNTLKWINYKKNVTNIFANEWEIHWWYISLLKNGGRPLARSSKLTYSSVDSYLIHFKIFVCQLKTTFKADLMWLYVLVTSRMRFRVSPLYSCLNMSRKGLLAWSRPKIWSLSDCNWTRTHNHLIRKRTLNHLAKLASLAKWLTVCLRTKCLWVWVQLQLDLMSANDLIK